MVLFRMFEIAIKRDIISRNFREALDELVIDIWKIFVNWLLKIKKIFIREFKKIPIFFLHGLIAFWGYALKKTLQAVSLVQGRGDGHAKGSVSAHLRTVELYKEQLKQREQR